MISIHSWVSLILLGERVLFCTQTSQEQKNRACIPIITAKGTKKKRQTRNFSQQEQRDINPQQRDSQQVEQQYE